MKILRLSVLFALVASAEETRLWVQTSFAEFEKGTAEGVLIRSDGALELAPRIAEIQDSGAAYIWDLAVDSKGAVYAAAGPDAKVFRIAPEGAESVFFETEAIEVHALAIDSQDNVYAATAPDSIVYKIDPSGESSEFYDPDSSYVWDMEFGQSGELYVATGDAGEIHRVGADGAGEVYYRTGETHVRSLAIDSDGNLIVGTDPSGLILRVGPDASGDVRAFVLYQSAKKEITSLTLGSGGAIYAAGVGARTPNQPAVPTAAPRPPTATATVAVTTGTAPQQQASAQQTAAVQPLPRPANFARQVRGGTSVTRISAEGEPQEVWTDAQDIVYSLGIDGDGKLLLGSGDRGRLMRLESDTVWSVLATLPSKQVTAFALGPDGAVRFATSNVGKVYSVGPELVREGSFESDILDAKSFSRWGRMEWRGETNGGTAEVRARSGNLTPPARNWSGWSAPASDPAGLRSDAPSARFSQWKATLKASGDGAPRLDSVSLYYRPSNIAPKITLLELTPPNFKFPPRRTTVQLKTVTLPALGAAQPRRAAAQQSGPQTLSAAQGFMGARWAATDANGDELVSRVEIKGDAEQSWKLLDDELKFLELSWDSSGFADGLYRIRVTVSDEPSNPAGVERSTSRVSEPFRIDNSEPAITNLDVTRNGGRLRVRFDAADSATKIEEATYSIDGGEWQAALPTTELFDSNQASFDFETALVEDGERILAVRVVDERGNSTVQRAVVAGR